MISKTKEQKYSIKVLDALLENYVELKETGAESNPELINPILDYELAVERVVLSDDFLFSLHRVKYHSYDSPLTNDQVATILGISLSTVKRGISCLKDSLLSEMNRGLSND